MIKTDNDNSRPTPLNNATLMNASMLATDTADACGKILAIATLIPMLQNRREPLKGTDIPSSRPCPLLSRCGQIISAGLAVNQAEDEVPHDRTPLLMGITIPGLCFRVFAQAGKMASSVRGIVSWAWADETTSRNRDVSPIRRNRARRA